MEILLFENIKLYWNLMILMVDDVALLNIVDVYNNGLELVLMLDNNLNLMHELIEDYMYKMMLMIKVEEIFYEDLYVDYE
jgi:hypothetical protein